MSFLKELKRRNVLRVAVAYLAVSWLVIQVVETLFPVFGLSAALIRLIVIVFSIGFPLVLVFSWLYELTPEGLKLDKDVDHSDSLTHYTGKKLDRMIMVVLALALGYFAFDKFVLSQEREMEITAIARQAGAEQALEKARLGMWNEKSIAVLPFINRSQLQEDEYFTDGMHDELLTRLAHISALKVISRTSVMRYRNTDKSLPEIARELSVATILEGGVQRAGNQVRINVQLINAHTDEHLWAKIFDRELTTDNLFGIQSEISKAIAEALQAELSPATLTSIEDVPTDNAEAYDLYLQAIRERINWRGADTFKAMKPLLERAVALDPNFLRPQILLVETYGRLLWMGVDPDRIYGAKALELVTDIRRRWPNRIEGRLALGHYYYSVERDYERALVEYQAVERVLPNDLEMLNMLGASLKRLGRHEEYLLCVQHLVVLDPNNPLVAWNLIEALKGSGLLEEALAAAEEGLKKFSDFDLWPQSLAWYRLFLLGDVEGFLDLGEHLRKEDRWSEAGGDLTWLLYGQGDVKSALEHAASRMTGDYGWNDMDAEVDRAIILYAEGRDDEARKAADHALGFVKSWVEAERPFPNINTRYWYTLAAYGAAISGNLELVTEYRALAVTASVDEYLVENDTILTNAHIDSLLGNAATGWARISHRLDSRYPPLLTAEYAAVHPRYQYLFGDVPAYQVFIAQAKSVD